MPIIKTPNDLWTYQELIFRCDIDTIIETGTAWGGSAWYFALLFDSLQRGHVVTVDFPYWKGFAKETHAALFSGVVGAGGTGEQDDTEEKNDTEEDPRRMVKDMVIPAGWRPDHPRITYVSGDSTDAKTGHEVRSYTSGNVMLSLDANHTAEHVLKELNMYAELVTPGSYIVVEDSNVNGHPVFPEHGPGPLEAIAEWLPNNEEFEIDTQPVDAYMFSYNTWIRRKDGRSLSHVRIEMGDGKINVNAAGEDSNDC